MRFAAPLLALALIWPGIGWAQDQPGPPVPLVPPPLPAAHPPAEAPEVPNGFQATPLGPLDPSWTGALGKDDAALPGSMWQGTPRAVVRAFLPSLGPAESPGLRDLARRLLLSGAVAPAGDDPPRGPSLLLLRAERLSALGAIAGARTILDAAPPASRNEAIERLRIELAFAGNDVTGACGRVEAGLAAHRNPWWDQANIACQFLTGARDKAMLALDILHDSGAAPDPTFDVLVAVASGQEATLGKSAVLSPLRIVWWASSKRPMPDSAIAMADAATAAAFAGDEDEPPANRLAAAERAALLGAWTPERLAELYVKASGADADRAKAVADVASSDTPIHRAILFTMAQAAGDAAQRVRAIEQFLAAASKHDLFPVAARLAAPVIAAIGPVDAAKSGTALFTRALIAAGRSRDVEPFLPLAPFAEIAPLVAIVHAVEGGRQRPDDKAMSEALAALALRPSEATPGQIDLFLTLATEFWGPMPTADVAAQIAPAHRATMPSAALWLAQQQAQASRRVGETVLTSVILAGDEGRVTTEPIRLQRALAGLRAVGLETDARSLALEAALAGGL